MNARPLLILDSTEAMSLQNRVRKCIVDAAAAGLFGSRRLPSSRSLARQLGVARNTVVLACARLVDEGFLVSRPRSGLYLSEDVARSCMPAVNGAPSQRAASQPPAWVRRLCAQSKTKDEPRTVPNWRRYPYPFVDGLCDPSLFPAAEWRDTNRLALSGSQIQGLSMECGDGDDPQLIEEIRSRLLPRRGIRAGTDEILVTVGAQHAFSLLAQVLVREGTTVGLEEPGHADLAELMRERGAHLVHQPVDEEGISIDGQLDGCDLLFVSPSHQYPTGAALSMERRRELLIRARAREMILVEHDNDCEADHGDVSLPSLRGLDRSSHVIYIADLPRVVTPGLQLGYMVGPAAFIGEARRRRRLGMRHAPLANQRSLALFLSLGHYDAAMLRIGRIFRERRHALRDALDYYLPQSLEFASTRAGAAFWVRGNQGIDATALIARAEQRGILLESAAPFFSHDPAPRHIFRMGVTGVPLDRIRAGVQALGELVRGMSAPQAEQGWHFGRRLDGTRLREALSGATIVYQTNYGEPCSIQVHRDGTLSGRLGRQDEETDVGVWSVQGDLWHRRWSDWAYGEPGAFHVAVQDGRLAWFSTTGRFIASSQINRQ